MDYAGALLRSGCEGDLDATAPFTAFEQDHSTSSSRSSRLAWSSVSLHPQSSRSSTSAGFLPPLASLSNGQALDRFASVYIPQWLLTVNLQQPHEIFTPNTTNYQDLNAYAESVYPKALIEDIHQVERQRQEDIARVLTSDIPRNVKGKHGYAKKFLALQFREHAARKRDLERANLYMVPLEPYTGLSSQHLYRLSAPAIREGWPALEPNDVVHLRQLRPDYATWQGLEFVATVHATRRVQGLIILKCEALNSFKESMLFNVTFRPQDRPFFAAHKAITYLDHQLPLLRNDHHLSQAWLYPSEIHHQLQDNKPTKCPRKLQWHDTSLNEEQRLAVTSVVSERQRLPFLVQGPPGTGKTKCLTEAVLQIVKEHPDVHLLVCGASNPSADTLAARLSTMLSPKQMFRLNDESRPLDEVRSSLLPWCHTYEDRFRLPSFHDFLSFRVVVTSVLDASVLCAARLTNSHLARLEEVVYTNFWPEKYAPTCFHFDYLLVDEAAQASEPDLSSALAAVLPAIDLQCKSDKVQRPDARRLPQLVLCGDHMQLGPLISSETARQYELDLSLLQRLFERPFYRDHPKARKHLPSAGLKLLRPMTTSAEFLPDGDGESLEPLESVMDEEDNPISTDTSVPFVHLLRNYRSHPGLLMVPSALFYNDTLIPSASRATHNTSLIRWSRLKGSEVPLLFWHAAGSEEMFEEGASWYNTLEVDRVVDVVTDLVRGALDHHGIVRPGEISVISPFREQVWRIRLALRALDLFDVNVGRESDMQGAENRIVVISTVRTSSRFIEDDRARGRGLLFEARRFNVATTRAKELLVIIGHTPTLYLDPYWRSMIRFAIRRQAFDGPSLSELGLSDSESDTTGISKLEEAFVSSRQQAQHSDILASSVARIALNGE